MLSGLCQKHYLEKDYRYCQAKVSYYDRLYQHTCEFDCLYTYNGTVKGRRFCHLHECSVKGCLNEMNTIDGTRCCYQHGEAKQ